LEIVADYHQSDFTESEFSAAILTVNRQKSDTIFFPLALQRNFISTSLAIHFDFQSYITNRKTYVSIPSEHFIARHHHHHQATPKRTTHEDNRHCLWMLYLYGGSTGGKDEKTAKQIKAQKKCERVKSNLTRDKRKSCYSFKFCADLVSINYNPRCFMKFSICYT
jgi:hypothetical protein